MTHGRLCPEVGRAMGLWKVPERRVRCLVCGRLVRLVVEGEHIVPAVHYMQPANLAVRRWPR